MAINTLNVPEGTLGINDDLTFTVTKGKSSYVSTIY